MAFEGTLQELTINMHGETEKHSMIEAQQGDTASRKVRIHLKTFGGKDYVIPYGATAVLSVNKTDGHKVLNECEIEDISTVIMTLTSQVLACPGEQLAQIYIFTDDGDIKSQKFFIRVPKAVYDDDAVESTDEYGILQNLIVRAEKLQDGATFTPHVSEDGTLSWTNDGGLDNPEPVNITGPEGPEGSIGATGKRGTGILKVTIMPEAYTTAIGDFSPQYRMTISEITSQTGVAEVLIGDIIEWTWYHYIIGYLDDEYAYISRTRTSIRGPEGAQGDPGANGKSAYEYAQDGGYDGTEEEFTVKLAKEYPTVDSELSETSTNAVQNKVVSAKFTEINGNLVELQSAIDSRVQSAVSTAKASGAFDGADGADGEDGKSAYEIYKENGGTLTEQQWLASLSQGAPEFANSVDEMTDTSKMYVMANGNIYAYKDGGGAAYTNVLDTVGYKTGYRVNSSGEEVAADGMCVTGFIPITNAQTLRIKNITIAGTKTGYVVTYDSSKTLITCWSTDKLVDDGTGIYEYTVGETSCAYIRVSIGTIDDTTIATVDEKIAESESGWVWTGLTYTPTGYEERIVTLETRTVDFGTRLEKLESGESDIPSYVLEEAERVINQCLSHNVGRCVRILACSDSHKNLNDAQSIASIKHASQAIDIIRNAIGIDLCIHLGDIANGGTETVAQGKEELRSVTSLLKDFVFAQGNHDAMWYAYDSNGEVITPSEMYALTSAKGKMDYIDGKHGYGYIDFKGQKFVAIVLNTSDSVGATIYSTGCEVVSNEQLKWLCETLAEFGSKEDYQMIILSHHPADWGYIYPVANIMGAYVEGGIVTPYSGFTYDFANKNNAVLTGQIHGHLHNSKVDYIRTILNGIVTSTTLQRLGTPNMSFTRNNSYGGSEAEWHGIDFGEDTTYTKVADTAQDTAFCIYTIDLDNRKKYADYYGCGYNREVSY